MRRSFNANLGRENYEWPNYHSRSTVAILSSIGTHDYWLARER